MLFVLNTILSMVFTGFLSVLRFLSSNKVGFGATVGKDWAVEVDAEGRAGVSEGEAELDDGSSAFEDCISVLDSVMEDGGGRACA